MHCIDDPLGVRVGGHRERNVAEGGSARIAAAGAPPAPRRALVVALGAAVAALAGCASRPSAAPPSRTPPPQPGAAPGPTTARNWDEFKLGAGQRLVAAHPGGTYLGRVPDLLFGIPVLETELNADGSVRSIKVLRRPSDPAAADTVELAIAAVRRAAPYGDVTRLPKPWTWVEAFLFNERRQFKPRSLD